MSTSYLNKIWVTTTSTGVGTLTQSGTVTGCRAPTAGDDGKTFTISIESVDANGIPTGQEEICLSVYTHSGTTWSRGTLEERSSRINFAAGTKRIAVVYPGAAMGETVNVKVFGATGDGTTDDTAAINAAITAVPTAGGVVYLPDGTYKVTGDGIALKNNVTLRGCSKGRILFGGDSWSGTVIDGQTITTAGKSVVAASTNLNNIVVESLAIRGCAATSAPNAGSPGDGVTCLNITSFVKGIHIRDVYVEGGSDGIVIKFSQLGTLENVHCQLSRNRGLGFNDSSGMTVIGGIYQNCGLSSNGNDGGIYLGGSFGLCTDITILQAVVDESAPACVNIGAATDIVLIGGRMYFGAINANGTGPGYGFKLGNGVDNPTRVTLMGWHVMPFSVDRIPTNTILAYGSGHKFIGISTNANGGGDIADNSTGSWWHNVNGFDQLAEISDPVAPAANSARLYARDNGAGKTQIVALFPTGAVQVIATQP